jgi:hypothetical protein
MEHKAIIEKDSEKNKQALLKISEDKKIDLSYIDVMVSKYPAGVPVVVLTGAGPYLGNTVTNAILDGTIHGYMFNSNPSGTDYCGAIACFVDSQKYKIEGFTGLCGTSGLITFRVLKK